MKMKKASSKLASGKYINLKLMLNSLVSKIWMNFSNFVSFIQILLASDNGCNF